MIRRCLLSLVVSAALLAGADAAVEQAKKKLAEKKYDEAITALETAHKAKPKDTEIQKTLAQAHLAKGDAFMTDEAVPPRQKYPTALRAYRQVLVYDKDNKKAKDGVAMIEGIYKQMGRPVPQ